MERFSRGTDEKTLRMAVAFLMTLPGIPVIYYGTEQSFEETRASMFAKGWGSGGKDHFEKGEMYDFIKVPLSSERVTLQRDTVRSKFFCRIQKVQGFWFMK